MIKEAIPELQDLVKIEDKRTQKGESIFLDLPHLRNFRGNYGVPRKRQDEVIKGFFCADTKTLNNLRRLHLDYQEELASFLPVLYTEVVIDGTYFYLKQPYIDGVTFEDLLKGNVDDKTKLKTYQELLSYSLGFIKGSNKIVGIDAKPENWIKKESQWYFVDLFPPFLIDQENTFGQIFNLRDFEKQFSDNPQRSYFRNLRKIARRFWLKSENFANLDYFEATKEVLTEVDKKGVKFLERLAGGYK